MRIFNPQFVANPILAVADRDEGGGTSANRMKGTGPRPILNAATKAKIAIDEIKPAFALTPYPRAKLKSDINASEVSSSDLRPIRCHSLSVDSSQEGKK